MLSCDLIMTSGLFYQVIAASQAGKHNDKRESYGDSLIIDPWGKIVGRLPGKDKFSCINKISFTHMFPVLGIKTVNLNLIF